MDNFTHTLFGLSLGKTGLERATPMATATLVLSSNIPDIDSVMRVFGPLQHLQHHRGITHSFVGLAVLATALTLIMSFVDKRFRLRRDPFRRPIRPSRVLLLAYLGGLGHTFMDYTNSYGVRPLLPFDERWLYGDLVFVVDPWIWLILGYGVVWLTVTGRIRAFIWIVIGVVLSLVVALSLREPVESGSLQSSSISNTIRITWFIGLAVIAMGAFLRLGRTGPRLARYSLVLLSLYYGGMWLGQQSALDQARRSPPIVSTDSSKQSLAVWPVPANPFLWEAVFDTRDGLFAGHLDIRRSVPEWQELSALDSKVLEALHQSTESRKFLTFARYTSGTIEESPTGFVVALRDLRFPLRMTATLDSNLAVESVEVRWN